MTLEPGSATAGTPASEINPISFPDKIFCKKSSCKLKSSCFPYEKKVISSIDFSGTTFLIYLLADLIFSTIKKFVFVIVNMIFH